MKKDGAKTPSFILTAARRHASVVEVMLHQHLQQLITVNVTDQTAGIVVRGYVGRVLRQNITNDLIDRIVTFLYKGIINDGEIPLKLDLPLLVH